MSDAISKSSVCEILADIYPTDGEKVVEVHRLDEAYDRVLQLPSAQPDATDINVATKEPEIVHCRDCKHYYYADNRVPQEQMCVCDLDGDRWTPDSFCSFGERKSE